jgi:hypothetical protein
MTAPLTFDPIEADLFARPGLPDHQLGTLFSVLRDLRREAGDFA